MNRVRDLRILFFLILLCAFLIRLIALDIRPMHHDEANQAVKFGNLLEKGEYRYDKNDHHGPSLYYLSLPFARIFSGRTIESLDESTLRLVPAVFGVLLIFLFLLLKSGLSRKAVVFSGLLAAVSPSMVFYSRFYIQETLLMFFLIGLIGSGWKYTRNYSGSWAIAAGFFAGMMYATKETSIILFGAIIGALVLTWLTRLPLGKGKIPISLPGGGHVILFFGTAALVSFLLYSSFLQNLKGPLDSILAFGTYFNRAAQPGVHSHPWFYYLKMLVYSKFGSGPVWSEALVLILAAVGSLTAFRSRKEDDIDPVLVRFVLFYTLLSATVFFIISYKTPWNLLPFYIGAVLLAGCGFVFIIKACKKIILRWAVISVICLGVIHLGFQCYLANFKYPSDPRNPYVYAHTSKDLLNLVSRVNDIAHIHPENKKMLIKVISDPEQIWPLPWYLRSFKMVGYWQDVKTAGVVSDVPVIISSMDHLETLDPFLQNYQSEFYGLRPEVLLALHINRNLWDQFLKVRSKVR